VTQAISGPFDLGRPLGCRPDTFSGGTRLNPKPPIKVKNKHKSKAKKSTQKGAGQSKSAAQRASKPSGDLT
jgi:hypothetical protein